VVDAAGKFRFTTIKAGCVPGPDGREQAPHLVLSVFMRGLLKRLITRIYFADDPRNDSDYILSMVEPQRRPTLMARSAADRPGVLSWNIVLQGPHETVFLDC
jgi:protocatechuate 3,4-dioxygenase, alpha subunit